MPIRSTTSPRTDEARPRVVQDRDAGLPQDARHLDAVVVVAENPEHALRCAQSREWRRGIGNVPAVAQGHVVPAEDHHVRCLSLQQGHRFVDER